mmetsp:Transcript_41697/g.89526  ORF Transcript_41697/g.89526 Transcript_41697/m.89526 type:complete len:322 (-) Transcript_41697:206-1171(-)|eukprot:CAMPEP_0206439182 /NCGR_PEP_ID=MMETSP0324_2-20121206/12060_1 /ASSEMBLY_ACC=CAM_ASM_000836 /TAXON_ID=2866 /ORGANISM="Crypthecodinium cohnii, Strain Seligo" /LENGTH=321 /DNA_ID=CAMNT_0053906757 /DNA_START=17 /DNA_END=982 /DNA_ORIENTATION=-
MMQRLLQCCNSHADIPNGELKVVHLSSDVMEMHMKQPVHLLTRQDSFDMTLAMQKSAKGSASSTPSRLSPGVVTPRQEGLRDRVWLPKLRRYPVPPSCSEEDPEDVRRAELLRMYQEFVLDLHKGIHVTQLTSNQDYSDIHCQILDDLQTLKIDQGSGCIIEFPLGAVSKVYRIVKNDDKWFSAGTLTGPAPIPPLPLSSAEHIVVVEFMRRKLAFVFNDIKVAQRFLMCIELLIRRAQEVRDEHDARPARRGASSPLQGGSSIAPMFSSFSTREPGERFGKSILPPSSALNGGNGKGLAGSQPRSNESRTGPMCTCEHPI